MNTIERAIWCAIFFVLALTLTLWARIIFPDWYGMFPLIIGVCFIIAGGITLFTVLDDIAS